MQTASIKHYLQRMNWPCLRIVKFYFKVKCGAGCIINYINNFTGHQPKLWREVKNYILFTVCIKLYYLLLVVSTWMGNVFIVSVCVCMSVWTLNELTQKLFKTRMPFSRTGKLCFHCLCVLFEWVDIETCQTLLLSEKSQMLEIWSWNDLDFDW